MSLTTKSGKRDQTIRREVNQEIAEETSQTHAPVRQRKPNRDQARGDWDRTGERSDEGMSRSPR
jgi:hypothetical protein